jgi:hypothetical protein
VIALFAAVAMLTTTNGTSSTDDQQLVAVTIATKRGCRELSITGFTIYKGYAVGGWACGETGGAILVAKREGQWARVTSGGGALNVSDLEHYLVPSDIAKILAAPCPPGRSHLLVGVHVANGAKVCTP